MCIRDRLRDSLVESWQMETEQVINLGASTIPSVYILPEVLPGFLKANSGIQIHIHQGDSREIISQVLEGNIKLGMVGMKAVSYTHLSMVRVRFYKCFHISYFYCTSNQKKRKPR